MHLLANKSVLNVSLMFGNAGPTVAIKAAFDLPAKTSAVNFVKGLPDFCPRVGFYVANVTRCPSE